jgi:hypothetical protein
VLSALPYLRQHRLSSDSAKAGATQPPSGRMEISAQAEHKEASRASPHNG